MVNVLDAIFIFIKYLIAAPLFHSFLRWLWTNLLGDYKLWTIENLGEKYDIDCILFLCINFTIERKLNERTKYRNVDEIQSEALLFFLYGQYILKLNFCSLQI